MQGWTGQKKKLELCDQVVICSYIYDQVYNEERNLFAIKVVNLLTKDGYTDKDLMHEIHLLKVSQAIIFAFKDRSQRYCICNFK